MTGVSGRPPGTFRVCAGLGEQAGPKYCPADNRLAPVEPVGPSCREPVSRAGCGAAAVGSVTSLLRKPPLGSRAGRTCRLQNSCLATKASRRGSGTSPGTAGPCLWAILPAFPSVETVVLKDGKVIINWGVKGDVLPSAVPCSNNAQGKSCHVAVWCLPGFGRDACRTWRYISQASV